MKVWIDGKFVGNVESARIEISSYENTEEYLHLIQGVDDDGAAFLEFIQQKARPLWMRTFKKPSLGL